MFLLTPIFTPLMTAILLEDVYSSVRKGKLYGAKNTRVTIIAQNANIVIVENENGRFAVKIKQLLI